MKEILADLHRKMDEIVGRQERTLSLISAVSTKKLLNRYPITQLVELKR